MELSFVKYQGTGNDFIIADNRKSPVMSLSQQQIIELCNRKFGIGADGIILIEEDSDSDFFMNYYNSDGSQSFCGNGSRCAVDFAFKVGACKESTTFKAIDGLHQGIHSSQSVRIKMGDVETFENIEKHWFLNTGSPHYIVPVTEDLDELDIISHAHKIRYNDRFKSEGTNVNFVKWDENNISVRTYERGVEDETLSCGTGVTAVALAHELTFGKQNKVEILTSGGKLSVAKSYSKKKFVDVWLEGPATPVYQGKIELK